MYTCCIESGQHVFAIIIYILLLTNGNCVTDEEDFTDFGEFGVFTDFFPSKASADTSPRRDCFQVTITNDDTHESTESFKIELILNPFMVQSGVLIQPNQTEVVIFDDDIDSERKMHGPFCALSAVKARPGTDYHEYH